jgi:hypothetical protein
LSRASFKSTHNLTHLKFDTKNSLIEEFDNKNKAETDHKPVINKKKIKSQIMLNFPKNNNLSQNKSLFKLKKTSLRSIIVDKDDDNENEEDDDVLNQICY